MKFPFMYLALLLPWLTARAQPGTHLNTYIQQAFATNDGLKQQQFLLQRNLYALQEAKTLYLPNVNLAGAYTLAGGGRTVDFPVGDLLNPVYRTLNQMTGADQFPQLDNQRILLNPNKFYDLHLRTTYPILNAEIGYNQRIKRQQYDGQQIEIDRYKRELAKDIKVGYYTWLQATEVIQIYENARQLVLENQRINQALFDNQKVNRTSVVRSTNEVTRVATQLEVARQTQRTAQAYVNFLLNRPAETTVERDSVRAVPDGLALADSSVAGREELAKLRQAQGINSSLVGLAQTYKRPKINAFLDLGAQGFNTVNRRSPYYFGGISLDWMVFSAGRNARRVQQVEADGLALNANTNYVTQQLRLQLVSAQNALRSSLAQHRAALSQVAASEKYYGDIQRLYREGQVLYIELLDAQNQLITDRLQVSITRFDAWTKQAGVEYANASSPLN
ncbi:TolC family protein [Spirosoma arcticum]